VTDGYSSAAPVASQQAGRLGVPAIARWQPMARKPTAQLIDSLVPRGDRDHVSGRRRVCARTFPGLRCVWCWRSLPLIFPAEVFAPR
jgi:hypothetical protein